MKIKKVLIFAMLFGLLFMMGCAEQKDNDINKGKPAQMTAQWLTESGLTDYTNIQDGTHGDETKVVFIPDKTVKDFKTFTLEFLNADEAGNISFLAEEVYAFDTLKPSSPLAIGMDFGGAVPNNGISYLDADGSVKSFTVQISGKDGSIVLCEYLPGFSSNQ